MVETAETGIAAFIALIAAVSLIGVAYYARRNGHLQSRSAVLAIAVIVALLVAYGMTGGVISHYG
jgi:uncharacterized membrane protein